MAERKRRTTTETVAAEELPEAVGINPWQLLSRTIEGNREQRDCPGQRATGRHPGG